MTDKKSESIKRVYAIAMIGDDRRVLIYPHQSGDGWHFPGISIAQSADGVDLLKEMVVSLIDGIKIDSCSLIGKFNYHGENEVYDLVCSGNPSRYSGCYTADFKVNLDDYQLSSTGQRIRNFYNRGVVKKIEPRLERIPI